MTPPEGRDDGPRSSKEAIVKAASVNGGSQSGFFSVAGSKESERLSGGLEGAGEGMSLGGAAWLDSPLAENLAARFRDGEPVEIFAPAKINLSLAVIGRRPDGYHELRGLMARLSWGDAVRMRLRSAASDKLTFEGLREEELDSGFAGARNLALRAVAAFRAAASWPSRGVAIHLVKRIPLGSGLGGGSSNAASVLMVLERAAGVKGLGVERLGALAAALGGDVPFFLSPSPLQMAEGIGEVLSPFSGRLPGDRVLLVNPGRPMSTAAVFRRLGLTSGQSSSKSQDADAERSTRFCGLNMALGQSGGVSPGLAPPLGDKDLLTPSLGGDEVLAPPLGYEAGHDDRYWSALARNDLPRSTLAHNDRLRPALGHDDCYWPPLGRNDLLRPALELDPELGSVREALSRLSPIPLSTGLSGSGPTFWALYGSSEAAVLAADNLRAAIAAERPRERWRVAVARVA